MPADTQSPAPRRISRRTVAAGAAWAVPAVAVTAASPAYAQSGITTTTTTLPKCVSEIGATGGTYPVTISLSNCSTASSHWDFIFKIKAATKDGTDCDCDRLRVTVFDNPKRSRLWISNNTTAANPQSNATNSPRLYVQKILNAGATGIFPAQGDTVYRVADSPYTGYTTGGDEVGPITAPGTADDSFHTIFNPTGGTLACSATGPMAYYTVECENPDKTWTQLGNRGEINPCVPMIKATVCRTSSSGNGKYRLGVSVLNACGVPASQFSITKIQSNDDTNFPNQGSSVFSSGPGLTPLGGTPTNIDVTRASSGYNQLWISFTTDGGANTSQIRVPIDNTTTDCPATTTTTTTCTAPANPSSLKRNAGTSTTFTLGWTASTGATSYEVRRCNSNGNSCSSWLDIGNLTSYQFTGLTTGTTYRYYVRAKKTCGASAATSSGSYISAQPG